MGILKTLGGLFEIEAPKIMEDRRKEEEEKKRREEEKKKAEETAKKAAEAARRAGEEEDKSSQISNSGLREEERRNLDIAAGIIKAPEKETLKSNPGAGNKKVTNPPASEAKTENIKKLSPNVMVWEMAASILNSSTNENYFPDAIKRGYGPVSYSEYLRRKGSQDAAESNQASNSKPEWETLPVTEKLRRAGGNQPSQIALSGQLRYNPDGSLDAASRKKIADAISQKKKEEQKSQIVKSIYDVIREYAKGDVAGTIQNAENAQVLTQRENIPILYDYMRQRYPGQGYRVSEAIIRLAKNYLNQASRAAVVDRGQQEGYNGNEGLARGLTQSQRERIWNGEGIGRIAGELPEEVQNELSRRGNELLTELTREQKRDMLFLSSGLLSGIDWETRQKILGVLKENEGRISYEDLEGMGVFKPGDLAEGGFKRWLQEHDIGGPANFDKLLSKEYELTQAETSFAELSQEEQRKRSQEWAMLLAMAAMPTIDTALYGKSGTIYGNNVYDNLESQGTRDIYKGGTTSWKPTVDTVGGGKININQIDDFFDDPKKFGDATPDQYYKYFQDNGYNPHPLGGKSSLKGIPFDQGGGFRISWGGDRYLQYHPSTSSHHGGAYWKISSGSTGTLRFDLEGNILP